MVTASVYRQITPPEFGKILPLSRLERGPGGEVVNTERGPGGEVVYAERGPGGEVVYTERGGGGVRS